MIIPGVLSSKSGCVANAGPRCMRARARIRSGDAPGSISGSSAAHDRLSYAAMSHASQGSRVVRVCVAAATRTPTRNAARVSPYSYVAPTFAASQCVSATSARTEVLVVVRSVIGGGEGEARPSCRTRGGVSDVSIGRLRARVA
jgi:hypothetical protein